MNGATRVTIRQASEDDALAITLLWQANKNELGAISRHRRWLRRQIDTGEVFLAETEVGEVVGFVVFKHSLLAGDEHTTIFYLCIEGNHRRRGVGRRLMEAVAADALLCGNRRITLRCPPHLQANYFYQSIGYLLQESETDQLSGPLNTWTLSLSAQGSSHGIP